MLEIFQNFIAILQSDPTLIAIVPTTSITVGPVDIIQETQGTLMKPQINLWAVSELQRSNPLNTRDTVVQIDIWSRNSQLELETIYERMITLLSYETSNQGAAHIFWTRLDGGSDLHETDRRIWHKIVTYKCYSLK